MTVSSALIPATDLTPDDVRGLRTAREVERLIERRRRSDRLAPQLPQRPQRVLQPVDHRVERAVSLPPLDGGAEVADQHARLGRLLAASIDFVMRPARVRG